MVALVSKVLRKAAPEGGARRDPLPPPRPRTLAEVAAAAGVSVPTVSKVLNQRADVAPATRQRVERTLVEHGYVVRRAGRALRTGKSGQIDFVVQSLQSDYAAEILRGVEEALGGTEIRAVLAPTHDHRQRERQWLQRLADGSTDGAIVVLADRHSPPVQELRRRAIPFVVVDRLGELGPGELSVSATNWAGGRAATQHLLELGHRRIAALLGPSEFPCTRDRLAGYRTALEAAGVPIDPALIHYGDWHAERAYEGMRHLLALANPPTAVFAGNDEQCLGIYRALYERGRRIPDTISVVGFDDMPYAPQLAPPLTTVRQPLREMGRVATKLLLRLIAGEPVEHVRVELATPLIQRGSSAPPPAEGRRRRKP
jgi:LacI family transcriptional regulator